MLRQFIQKVQRGQGPFYAFLKRSYYALMSFSFTPKRPKSFFHFLYHFHFFMRLVLRQGWNMVYSGPLFKARCHSVGKNLSIWMLPDVVGAVELYIGDDVEIFGHLAITSGRIFDRPRLEIGDRVDVGHNVQITVNQEVIIGAETNIAYGVRISDTDGHPRDTEARAQGLPPPPHEIKPVRIGRRAWLGGGCWIMKGVTIGEGAVIGVNSVVLTDIPPYAVAMGNPARVVTKDVRAVVPAPQTSAPV